TFRVAVRVLATAAALLLAGCAATTRPQQFHTFLLPPSHPVTVSTEALLEPPRLGPELYASEAPLMMTSLPSLPRPSDIDFLLKKADDRFVAGKRAMQEGRTSDARVEFNRALETLLTAPDNLGDRSRLERRFDELVEAIYRYDLDLQASAEPEDKVDYDQSPLDGIVGLTFPVDPALRNKIKEQIEATASQLPLEESDAVVGAINFFTTERGKKIIASGLRRSGRYKDLIERVLAEEGLPQELIFLAQAESGFSPRARSNKQCVGLWQFAQFRGKEYGLQQTTATDDRMDPEKATRAAARHLHDLYSHFGDWYLAMAAYDCGPGCVDHAVMRTGFADYWKLRSLNVLPKETSNYVPVILAMTIIAKNAKDYGLDNLEFEPPVEVDTLELQTPTHLALVADAVERPLSELRELNPALIKQVAPAGYSLHVPKGTLQAVESAFAIVPPNRRDSWRLHRVESGDTFATLAKRYSAAATTISEANHDALPEAGSLVAIPVSYPGDRVAKPAAKRASTHKAAGHAAPAAASASTKKTAAGKGTALAEKKAAAKPPVHRAAINAAPAS
ncbi:MAG: transglycosylase SLT domain-containing protein, partial [Bryobacteraceae bacterium]